MLKECVEGLTRSNFDDATEDIGIDAVVPPRSRLKEEGGATNGTRHFSECFVTVKRLETPVVAIYRVPAPAIGEAGGVAKEVANRGHWFCRGRVASSLPNI